jgi:hypothetical protein
MWNSPRDGNARGRLLAFGLNIRRARRCAGYSQQRLSDLSGVSQSVISRLERARAPRLGLERILALHEALGGCLPLGTCPHDHSCIWKPQSAQDLRSRHAPGDAPGLEWGLFKSTSPTETTPSNRLGNGVSNDLSPGDWRADPDSAPDPDWAADPDWRADPDSAADHDSTAEHPILEAPNPTENSPSNRLGKAVSNDLSPADWRADANSAADPNQAKFTTRAGKLAARVVDLAATTGSDQDIPD